MLKEERVTLEESVKRNPIFHTNGQAFCSENRDRDQPPEYPHIVQLSGPRDQSVYIATEGLVGVATTAYNKHHDLVWRPDDVWQAILTQFSFYVTHNSEKLQDKFVDFKGKRELEIETFENYLLQTLVILPREWWMSRSSRTSKIPLSLIG